MTVAKTIGTNARSVESDELNLDSILIKIGQSGKFQFNNLILLCVPMIFIAVVNLSYVFTASTVVQRCRVPVCDNSESAYQEPWTNFSIPTSSSGVLDTCKRYVTYNSSLELDVCSAENFDQESIEPCGTDVVFRDDEVTISNEFRIFCDDEWKLPMVGTVNMVGQFVGVPLGGYIADKYGRQNILGINTFLCALFGIIRSFSFDYYMFIVLEFLDSICGATIYVTTFILCLELVGPKSRVLICSLVTLGYTVGEVILALVAKFVPNWRLMLRILYIPALFHLIFTCILPESVRWLLSQGEEEQAINILRHVAEVNKRKLSEDTIESLVFANRYKLARADEASFPFKKAFQYFRWRIISCSFCWFTNGLVFYGLTLFSVLLGGNKYDTFIYVALIEIPGILIAYLTLDRIGRRYTLFGCFIVCAICMLFTMLVSSDNYTLQLTLFLFGKMAISASGQVLMFYTAELFPTRVRGSLTSVCTMVWRGGSILAPLTPILVKLYEPAPAILFSGCAFISAFLPFLFPETANVILPTTIDDAESIGQKKKPMGPQTWPNKFKTSTGKTFISQDITEEGARKLNYFVLYPINSVYDLGDKASLICL